MRYRDYDSELDIPRRCVCTTGQYFLTIINCRKLTRYWQPHKLFCLNVTSSFLAFSSFVIALFAISYASIINNRGSSPSSGTLNSWTCQWQDFQSIAPANFTKICNEGNAAVDLVILLVVLEALALVLTAGGWMVEMRLKRAGGVRSGKSEVELV